MARMKALSEFDFKGKTVLLRVDINSPINAEKRIVNENRIRESVPTLRKLLDARSETVRLGAARAILELGGKLREQEDITERVRALEERLAPAVEGKEPPRWSRTG